MVKTQHKIKIKEIESQTKIGLKQKLSQAQVPLSNIVI
jgi:hypothetical protein